jgi:MFS family permease
MNTSAHRSTGSLTYVCLLTLVAALGGLLFGYDTAVIADAIGYLKDRFALTSTEEGFAAAIALAGCALGAGTAGFLSDRFGRKKVLVLAALAFFVSAVGTALPQTMWEFVAFRLIGGIGIGAASITSPMYIAEITPFRIRGRMVSLNQLAIVAGMLIVYFVNYFIAHYGLAHDRQIVAAQSEQHGAALDIVFVKVRLDKEVRNMIAPQIEEFFAESRGMDRHTVAEFLAQKGWSAVQPSDIGGSDGPLDPTTVRNRLRQHLPTANRCRIKAFLEAPGQVFDSQAVAKFLDQSGIKADPVAIDLESQGLRTWNADYGWRWMFGSGVFPALVFLLLLFLVPESPRWLVKKERRDEALAILTRVDGSEYAQTELRGIEAALAEESGQFRELWQPWMRRILVLGVALAVLQQVTGVNVFLYFAPKIFESLGAGASAAMLQTILVGAVMLVFTLLAIGVVDRLGRKPLMLIGAAGMGLALTALGLAAYFRLLQWWALVFVLGYIACFAMSVGPVTWVILSEIFPTKVRGRAMGIATICLWLANYVVSQTFPMMNDNPWLLARFHHGFPFWVYAGFCVVLFGVVFFCVPETKGKSLEEIERSWKR